MRTSSCWLLLACLATACGGTFSNDDLEFLNALPVREDLSAKLPEGEASARALGVGPLGGEQALGTPSPLYADTQRVSGEFNAGLDGLLTLLETIRALPPTTRAPDLRVWGPAPVENRPDLELRFVMKREAARFDYALQFRPAKAGEEAWWSALEGTFQADGGLRQGEGFVRLLLGRLEARGVDTGELSGLERLDIAYQTRELPTYVLMRFVPAPGSGKPEIAYTYRELPEGLGEMAFLIADTNVLPGSRLEDLAIVSRWTRDQGGVAFVAVTGGDVPAGFTATQVECWDAAFQLTYRQRTWESGKVGSPSACPDVSALER